MSTATPKRASHLRSGSMDDTTPSRRGRSYTRQQFKATDMWNNIQMTFVNDCPRKRHRRQFVYVDDSFTGKDAVDFLMEVIPSRILSGRPVERSNCTALLQKFLNLKLFYRYGAKDPKDQLFKDNNTLYCFSSCANGTVPRLIADGSAMRRSSSVTHIRRQSLSPIRPGSPWSPHQIPNSPGKLTAFNKRLSISHGNLSHFEVSTQPSPKIDTFREVEKDTTPTCDRTRGLETPKADSGGEGIYEFLKFSRRRKKNSVTQEEAKTIPAPVIMNSHPVPVPTPALGRVANRMLTEVDLWGVWKTCLLKRMRQVMPDLAVNWVICGYEVKWNCEKIGTSGVVKSRSDADDFSAFIMRLMKYLEQFPFHTSSVNVMTYRENQEINVFKTVCSNLSRDPPLLTSEEAEALLHIIATFHEKTGAVQAGFSTLRDVRSPFSNLGSSRGSVSPMSILSTPMSNYSDLPPAIRTNGLNEQIAFSTRNGKNPVLNPLNNTRRERRSMSDNGVEGRLSVEDALQLPGLKQSPDMLKRIKELCVSPDSRDNSMFSPSPSLSCKTAQSCLSPVVNKLPREEAESLLTAVSLVLLSIPCSRRRRIHHLVRFMNKLCSNHCLQLDLERDNRYVVLESLAPVIVPIDGGLTLLHALRLVTLLVDYERRLFSVDEQLRRDVNETVAKIQREKVMHTEEIVLNGATPPTNVVQFCEPVDKEAFEEQTAHVEDHLMPLLDRYINDENMKPSEKEKRLKQFKAAHPDVYTKRFPTGDPPLEKKPPSGFFRRVLFKK